MREIIDFGGGITGEWCGWHPDRELNPQYANIPDIEKVSLILHHTKPDGTPHEGIITIDQPGVKEVFGKQAVWQCQSLEPLTLSPSILCSCGWHGHIVSGKWVPC